MDHPDFIVCSFIEHSIGLKRVKEALYCYFRYEPYVEDRYKESLKNQGKVDAVRI